MKFFTAILLCCYLLPAYGQKVKVQDGWLMANDSFYCRYQENDNVADKAYPQPARRIFAVWETDEFYDFTLSTVDSLPCIVVKAMTLAVANQNYLSFYYAIKFPFLDKEINIRSQPYFRENFLKDVIKYKAFENGMYSEAGTQQLYDKWQHKKEIIPAGVMANSVSTNYNKQPQDEAPTDADKIKLSNDTIYNGNIMIGSYQISQEIKDVRKCYSFYNAHTKYVAGLWMADTRVQAYLEIPSTKDKLTLVTANKSDEFLLKRVAVLLLKMKVL